jgi:hypothetical protein
MGGVGKQRVSFVLYKDGNRTGKQITNIDTEHRISKKEEKKIMNDEL